MRRSVRARSALGAAPRIDGGGVAFADTVTSIRRIDLILHIGGSRSWSDYRRVLQPQGTLVLAGASSTRNSLLGPLGHIARMRLASIRGRQKSVFFIAKANKPDLDVLREMLESGQVKPVVERTYDLSQTADALRYLGEGYARGKLAITVPAG
jgi:NADPH:quinone reductase-like Zn-dependent oxidoreductase